MQSATLALLAAVTFLVVLVLAIWDLVTTTKDLPKESLESAEVKAFNAMSHDGPRSHSRAAPVLTPADVPAGAAPAIANTRTF